MNDHNLDDLIIDNIKPKNGKAKSFLTIVALLVIVLIVAIILTKIILKDPNEGQAVLEEDNTEMISPELRLQNVAKKKEEAKEETKLSTIIEKELSEPVKAPEVKEIVETAEPVQVQKTEVEEAKAKVAETAKPKVEEVKEEVAAPQSVEITKEFVQSPTVPEVKESPKVEEVVVPETKPTPVEEKKPETITSVSGETYYIQVGSFSQTPSSRFLGVIKNSGFNYKITTSGKTKKLLIGPYKNRGSANTALVRVKDRINKSAFVVKK